MTPIKIKITNRQYCILQELAKGLTPKAIARNWGYRQGEVIRADIRDMFAAFNVKHAVHLVAFAYNNGLLQPQPDPELKVVYNPEPWVRRSWRTLSQERLDAVAKNLAAGMSKTQALAVAGVDYRCYEKWRKNQQAAA